MKLVLFGHLRPGDSFCDENSKEYFLITHVQYFVCFQEPVHPNFLVQTINEVGKKQNFYESPNCPIYFKDLTLVSDDVLFAGEDNCQHWKSDKHRELLTPPNGCYEMLNINLKSCR